MDKEALALGITQILLKDKEQLDIEHILMVYENVLSHLNGTPQKDLAKKELNLGVEFNGTK